MVITAICAFAAALLITLVWMPVLLPILKKKKFGQTIYELGPKAHLSKQGTPNMGGLTFACATMLVMLVAAIIACASDPDTPFFSIKNAFWPLLLSSAGAMAVGFSDDFIKDFKKQHEGLKPMQKIAGQVIGGLVLSVLCYFTIGHDVALPFTAGKTWDLGLFYIPLMTLVFIFMTNSANLQDGVDGILSTVNLIGMIAFGVLAILLDSFFTGTNTYASTNGMITAAAAFALAGGCLGFLKFNHHPAQIFMGDTGSMFIGGMMVGLSMVLKVQFLLIPICFTCIMSSVSVMMQTTYFKITKKKYGQGRRIFKMTPIHHHFELSGMSENKIVIMYGIVTLILSVAAILSMTGFMG